MTDPLSPPARATYDAFNRVGLYNEPSFETDRKALAAALRAAADQVIPLTKTPWGSTLVPVLSAQESRKRLLAIADELEGVNA